MDDYYDPNRDDDEEAYRVVRPRRQPRFDEAPDEPRQKVTWIVLGALAVVVVIAGLVLGMSMFGGGDDNADVVADGPGGGSASTTKPSSDSSTTTSSTTSTTTSSTTSTTTPTTEPQTTAVPTGPLTGTAVRTCGSDGGAKCMVAIREAPSVSAKAVSRLYENETAVFECTVMGDEVASTVLGRSTSVWARTENGLYVSMAFLDIPGWDTFTTTHPC